MLSQAQAKTYHLSRRHDGGRVINAVNALDALRQACCHPQVRFHALQAAERTRVMQQARSHSILGDNFMSMRSLFESLIRIGARVFGSSSPLTPALLAAKDNIARLERDFTRALNAVGSFRYHRGLLGSFYLSSAPLTAQLACSQTRRSSSSPRRGTSPTTASLRRT